MSLPSTLSILEASRSHPERRISPPPFAAYLPHRPLTLYDASVHPMLLLDNSSTPRERRYSNPEPSSPAFIDFPTTSSTPMQTCSSSPLPSPSSSTFPDLASRTAGIRMERRSSESRSSHGSGGEASGSSTHRSNRSHGSHHSRSEENKVSSRTDKSQQLPSSNSDKLRRKEKSSHSSKHPTTDERTGRKAKESKRVRRMKRNDGNRNSFLEVSDDDLDVVDSPESLTPRTSHIPVNLPSPSTPLASDTTSITSPSTNMTTPPAIPPKSRMRSKSKEKGREKDKTDLAGVAFKLLTLPRRPEDKGLPRPLIALLFLLEIMSFVRYLKTKRRSSVGSVASTIPMDEKEDGWEEWRNFIQLVYLSEDPPALLPIIKLPDLPEDPLSTSSTLHQTCDALGVFLESNPFMHSFLPVQYNTLFDLLSLSPSIAFPHPDMDDLEHLSLSMGQGIHSSLFLLADRMAHFFGSQWGMRTDKMGRVCYAEGDMEDKAIRGFFGGDKKRSIPTSQSTDGSGESEARLKEEDVTRRMRELNTSSLKRDDKLRWLLGPSYTAATSPQVTPIPNPIQVMMEDAVYISSDKSRRRTGLSSSPTSPDTPKQSHHPNSRSMYSSHRTNTMSSGSSLSRRHSTSTPRIERVTPVKRPGTGETRSNTPISAPSVKSGWNHWRGESISGTSVSDERESVISYSSYTSHRPLMAQSSLEGVQEILSSSSQRRESEMDRPRRKFSYPETPITPIGNESGSGKFKNLGPYLIKNEGRAHFQSLSTSDLIDLNIVNLPPTSNHLSPKEKMVLVKRSRKLQALLGETLPEEQVEHGLMGMKSQDIMFSRGRRSSFPPGTPSISSKRTSVMSGFTDLSTTSTIEANSSKIRRSNSSRLGTIQEPSKLRQDRRKKLVKLQRFLGEPVPINLIEGGGNASTMSLPISRDPSLPLSLSDSRDKDRDNKERKGSLFGMSFAIGKKKNHSLPPEDIESIPSINIWNVGSQSVRAGTKMDRNGSSMQGSSNFETLEDIRRARKLEQMFGELPPEAFNTHRRLLSDTVLTIQPTSVRPASVASSVYRHSIATLTHIIDHEPEALTPFINHYNDEDVNEEDSDGTRSRSDSKSRPSPPRLSISTSESEEEGWDGEMRKSLSSDGHRQNLKRAAKLANFFGTTRGDIFKQVLDDLEEAILEETIPEEERDAVLDNLRKLRLKTVTSI